MSTIAMFRMLSRIVSAASILAVLSGCDGGLDKYDGDVEDIAVTLKQVHGAVITFHLGKEAGILPDGKIVGVKVRLKEFPDKEFIFAHVLAEKKGLISQHNFPQGGLAVVVEASRVRFHCKKGSTNVVSISILARKNRMSKN